MSRAQNNARCMSCLERLLPTCCEETPTASRLQTRKTERGYRCGEIVSGGLRKREKLGRHHHANRMAADVLCAGIAAAVSIETSHGLERAEFEAFAEDVERRLLAARPVGPVISQHDGLQRSWDSYVPFSSSSPDVNR